MELGKLVRELRDDLGMTQQQLGDFLGVVKTQVSMIENDKSGMPAQKLLDLLEEAGWSIHR